MPSEVYETKTNNELHASEFQFPTDRKGNGWDEDSEKDLNEKVVGDIGPRGGFFTLKFASFVRKKGKVYVTDNNQKNLNFIYDYAKKAKQYRFNFV